MSKAALIEALEGYNGIDQNESEMVERTCTFLKEFDVYQGKSNLKGHITGSSWIVNKDRSKVLLTHHYKLNIWVQLGGHSDEGETIFESAFREGVEESGLTLTPIHHDIYDVDVHLIPERKGIPAHYHHDIRYLFEADENENIDVSNESHDVKWVAIKDIENYSKDRSILRMVEKMV